MKKLVTLTIVTMLVLGFSKGYADESHILATAEMKSPTYVLDCTIVNVHPWQTMDVKIELINAQNNGSIVTTATCADVPPDENCQTRANTPSYAFCRFTTNLPKKHVRAAIQAEQDAQGATAALPAY